MNVQWRRTAASQTERNRTQSVRGHQEPVREGALDNLAPGSARGNQSGRDRAAAKAAATTIQRSTACSGRLRGRLTRAAVRFPGQEPGAMLYGAPSRRVLCDVWASVIVSDWRYSHEQRLRTRVRLSEKQSFGPQTPAQTPAGFHGRSCRLIQIVDYLTQLRRVRGLFADSPQADQRQLFI